MLFHSLHLTSSHSSLHCVCPFGLLSHRFKSAKAGGDVKGRAKVEPYAYWQFDRKVRWVTCDMLHLCKLNCIRGGFRVWMESFFLAAKPSCLQIWSYALATFMLYATNAPSISALLAHFTMPLSTNSADAQPSSRQEACGHRQLWQPGGRVCGGCTERRPGSRTRTCQEGQAVNAAGFCCCVFAP